MAVTRRGRGKETQKIDLSHQPLQGTPASHCRCVLYASGCEAARPRVRQETPRRSVGLAKITNVERGQGPRRRVAARGEIEEEG